MGRLARGGLIVIGLILGLGLAAITRGTVGHLRMVMQENIPEWSTDLTPDSTLMAGQKVDAQTGDVWNWRFQNLSLSGVHYTVTARGAGHEARGDVKISWSIQTANITEASGRIDLAQLYPNQGITGSLEGIDISATLDLDTRTLQRLVGQGALQNASADAAPLGRGALRLIPTEAGTWQGTFVLSSPGIAAQLSGQGVLNQTQAMISGEVSETPEMPDRWVRWLNTNLSKTADGWAIDQSVDLKAPLGGR